MTTIGKMLAYKCETCEEIWRRNAPCPCDGGKVVPVWLHEVSIAAHFDVVSLGENDYEDKMSCFLDIMVAGSSLDNVVYATASELDIENVEDLKKWYVSIRDELEGKGIPVDEFDFSELEDTDDELEA